MNRRSCWVLFSLILLVGVLYFFSRPHSPEKNQASQDVQKPDLESSQSQKKVLQANRKVSSQVEVVPQQTDVASSPVRSGKYNIKVSQAGSAPEKERAKQFEFLQKNSAGLEFQSSDQQYVVMKLRASREKVGNVVDQQMGHEVFPINPELAKKVIVEADSYPVVVNKSNGKVGFLTGVILLQPEAGEEVRKIVSRYPVDLQIYDESIGLATLKVREGEGLFDVFNQIRQNERVSSISFEILDSYKGI